LMSIHFSIDYYSPPSPAPLPSESLWLRDTNIDTFQSVEKIIINIDTLKSVPIVRRGLSKENHFVINDELPGWKSHFSSEESDSGRKSSAVPESLVAET
jgi:hypothetical protein